MRRPLITGVSGYFGSRLIQELDSDNEIQQIIGIDISEPKFSSQKLKFFKRDINDFSLRDIIKEEDVDSVFHFSFIVNPIHDSDKMFRTNVNGTRHILDICHRLRIRKILVTSSASAYGAHPDNPELLKESAPLRGNNDYQYARDKKIIDEMCQDYMKMHSDTIFILVRPCIVLGPHVSNYISESIRRNLIFTVRGHNPLMQFVHEDDISMILYTLMKNRIGGIFNISGDGKIRLSEIISRAGLFEVKLPYGLARFIGSIMWNLHIEKAPPSLLPFIMYPWLVDNSYLKSKINNEILKYDTISTLEEFLRSKQNEFSRKKKTQKINVIY